MRIIIDTNLWISFMLGRKIATMRTLLTHPSLEIYVCRELLDEFYDVSSREKIRKYIRPGLATRNSGSPRSPIISWETRRSEIFPNSAKAMARKS